MKLEAFQRVLKSIGEGRSLEGTLREIVESFREKTGARCVGIWLLNEPDGTDVPDAQAVRAEDDFPPVALAVDGSFPFRSAREWPRARGDLFRFLERESVRLMNAPPIRTDWRAPGAFREGGMEFVGFRLKFHGKLLGLLGVWTRNRLNDDETRWGRTLAYQAAVAVMTSRNDSSSVPETWSSRTSHRSDALIGKSRRFLSVLDRAELVAQTDACVLLTGASGTGKSQLAAFIHRHGSRGRNRFVEVNCGSIAPHLFETEFFGHVRGAFTGASRDRLGRFQFADGGTLFLDEVAEIPLELQSRLLTVLQTGVFARVGEDEPRRVDVRIIAATNRDLPELVSEGRFREDLYYRLNVFPIEMPLLRDRIEDLPLLARHFLERLRLRHGRAVPDLDDDHLRFLNGLEWEGNIRELEHRLERALILSNGGRLQFEDWTEERPGDHVAKWGRSPEVFLREDDVRRLESENLRKVLEVAKGKVYGKGGAAELLGVPPTTVMSRLKNLGLDRNIRKSREGERIGESA